MTEHEAATAKLILRAHARPGLQRLARLDPRKLIENRRPCWCPEPLWLGMRSELKQSSCTDEAAVRNFLGRYVP